MVLWTLDITIVAIFPHVCIVHDCTEVKVH